MESLDKQLKEFEEIDEMLENKELFSGSKLFKCILGLNETEAKVFGHLSKNKNVGTIELTDKLKKDRSNIQRAVTKLSELNLIERTSMSMKEYIETKKTTSIKKQGYLYVYNVKEMDSIKAHLKKLVEKWSSSMLKYINELDQLCKNCNL